ncbi:MAG: YeeE/YedE thiosulfate transporter family protein [Waddliaceae bacterium]
METFTPFSALAGGVIIGLSSAAMLYLNGRICGISGMVSDLVTFHKNLWWSGFFLLGMFSGGVFLRIIYPFALDIEIPIPSILVFFGGILVGFGTRMGGGCTSGHGVCGVGMGYKASMIATFVFVFFAMMTATLLYHFFVGDPRP